MSQSEDTAAHNLEYTDGTGYIHSIQTPVWPNKSTHSSKTISHFGLTISHCDSQDV